MKIIAYLLFSVSTLLSSSLTAQMDNGWTIMHYGAGSNSSEVNLLDDIAEMMTGKQSDGYRVISLIDRIDGHSEDSVALGENFTDTRLYELHQKGYTELDGRDILPELSPHHSHDLNMGDAAVLKRFIQYCKKYFPADHYLLVLRSHGNGTAMCPDVEQEPTDRLYPAELTAELGAEESVDILGLDVCSMAGLENAYQWRPGAGAFSADYIIASAPLSGAWAYDQILERLHSGSTQAGFLDPYTARPIELAELIMEEILENQRWASWALIDNAHIESAKKSLDELAVLLTQEPREVLITLIEHTLSYHHNTYNDMETARLSFPYLDAYDFVRRIAVHDRISDATRKAARHAAEAIDRCVVRSYYGRGYLPESDVFTDGQNGVYLIIPQGHQIYSQTDRSYWAHTGWFHPDDQTHQDNAYGKYRWCRDGAIPANNRVENFYEWLDYLFDELNDHSGGVNAYRY